MNPTRGESLAGIKRKLRILLSARRYAHSLSTARLATELAPAVGVACPRAYLAGLLHDCARDLDHSRLKRLLAAYHGRYLDAGIRAEPKLWHNPVAAYLVFHKFGVRDPGILRAIARHSIGGPGMHPLDKLIYVADYCEVLRTHTAARGIRALAFKDLDGAVSAVARAKLAYLQSRGLSVHPDSLALAREYGISRLYGNPHFKNFA